MSLKIEQQRNLYNIFQSKHLSCLRDYVSTKELIDLKNQLLKQASPPQNTNFNNQSNPVSATAAAVAAGVDMNILHDEDDINEMKLLDVAVTNIKEFLVNDTFFDKLIQFIKDEYGSIGDYNSKLKLIHELKYVFYVFKNIFYNLIMIPWRSEFGVIRKYSGPMKFIHELLSDELIQNYFLYLGFKADNQNDIYLFDYENAKAKHLIQNAFNVYLIYYFLDNIINFIENYLKSFNRTCDAIVLLELLVKLNRTNNINYWNYDELRLMLENINYLKDINRLQQQNSLQPATSKQSVSRQNSNNPNTTAVTNVTNTSGGGGVGSGGVSVSVGSHTNTNNNAVINYNRTNSTKILTNEQWSCESCTFLNDYDKNICAICSRYKESKQVTYC